MEPSMSSISESGSKAVAMLLKLFQYASADSDLLNDNTSTATQVATASVELLLDFIVNYGCAWVSSNGTNIYLLLSMQVEYKYMFYFCFKFFFLDFFY